MWVHTLLESSTREVSMIADDMVRKHFESAREALKEQLEAKLVLLREEQESEVALLRQQHAAELARADAHAATLLQDEVHRVMKHCMEEANKAKEAVSGCATLVAGVLVLPSCKQPLLCRR